MLFRSAMLLLIAGLALHEAGDSARLVKLESRIGLVQVSGEEFVEKASKSFTELSDAVNFLRGELQQVSRNAENRLAALELAIQNAKPDSQKYYDLVQKVIELENRISALGNRKEEGTAF